MTQIIAIGSRYGLDCRCMSLILAATDFSPLAQRSVDYAGHLAASSGAELCLIHIVEPIENPETADEETRVFHAELLEKAGLKLAAEIGRLGRSGVTSRVELGHRVPTLVSLVKDLSPWMLVMGTTLQDWPTTHRVGIGLQFMVQAVCPVLFVP